ncbi:hypothetical protein [Actinomycetospora sp. TBRC 11914]|uniref:hypothetical protein n=1 Tax=Actinomycetospora sp. TBRC 11914 TaxID=2729387 RepID=UPI00145C46DD|nr:hypothetical protein [Actinomycetospora sp. TBRC 11914]NMO88213.1 hypothetical protein [Actinomycetospora sp. TBRC 11914]
MWWLLSAGVAAVASLIEIFSGYGTRIPKTAAGWVSLRVFIDGFVGAVIYAPATAVLPATWSPTLTAFLAGLSGAAILRASINVNRGSGPKASLGLESGYSRLLDQVNKQIKSAGQLDTTSWLAGNRDMLTSVDYQEFALIARLYLLQDPVGDSKVGLDLIKRLQKDGSKTDEEKREELLNHLVKSNEIALLRLVVKEVAGEDGGERGKGSRVVAPDRRQSTESDRTHTSDVVNALEGNETPDRKLG